MTGYKSELPQLKQEVKELEQTRELIDIKISAKIQRIRQLETEEEEGKTALIMKAVNRQQAATELFRLLDEYGNNMLQLQYQRLEELSGISSKKIKQFLEEKQYFPTMEEISSFFEV